MDEDQFKELPREIQDALLKKKWPIEEIIHFQWSRDPLDLPFVALIVMGPERES